MPSKRLQGLEGARGSLGEEHGMVGCNGLPPWMKTDPWAPCSERRMSKSGESVGGVRKCPKVTEERATWHSLPGSLAELLDHLELRMKRGIRKWVGGVWRMYMRVYTWFYTVRGSGVVHCPLGDVLGKRWMRAPLLFRVTRHAAHWHLGFL